MPLNGCCIVSLANHRDLRLSGSWQSVTRGLQRSRASTLNEQYTCVGVKRKSLSSQLYNYRLSCEPSD
jgi:hypothetical protein